MARPRARTQTHGLALAALVALNISPSAARADCWDADADETPDVFDNCPMVANDDQADTDQDGAGDACDCRTDDPTFRPGAPDLVPDGEDQDCDQAPDDGADTDGDLIEDTFDNCPFFANPDQVDVDQDGQGDACKILQVVAAWPPAYCEGVPAGLPLRARFNRAVDAAVVALVPAVQVRGELRGPLDTQTLLDDDLAGLTVSIDETPLAGERVHALVGAAFGLPIGYQWRVTTATRPSDPIFETVNLDGLGAFGLAAGDLDGDGAPDLVLCGFPVPALRVLLNRGPGGFVPTPPGPNYGACAAIQIADLDADGDNDVVLQDLTAKVRVLRNDGGGALTPDAAPVLLDGAPFDLGDFDADGAVDLLGPRTSLDNQGRVRRNVGGNFGPGIGGMGGFVASGSRMFDFEPDGDLDIMLQNGSDPRGLTAGRNLGIVGVQNLGRVTGNELGAGGTAIDVADIDGDGRPEIAVSSYGQASQLYWFDPNGALQVGAPLPGTQGAALLWADLEGDGDPDLWYQSANDDLRVLRNDGAQQVDSGLSLAPRELPPSPNQSFYGFRVVDMDADGDLDAVVDGPNPRVLRRRADLCPNDPAKIDPGACGCGLADTDADADLVLDCDDLCPFDPTPVLGDLDADGLGDPCDPDDDEDGVPDFDDADPIDPTRCADTDADGCDDCAGNLSGFAPGTDADPANDGVDRDQDGICETTDNCPFGPNPDQADADQDSLGDVCDPCPGTPVNAPGCGVIPDVEPTVDAMPPSDATLSVDAASVIVDAAVPVDDAAQHRLDLRVAADAGGMLDAAAAADAASAPADLGELRHDAVVMPGLDQGLIADAAAPPVPDAVSPLVPDAATPPVPDAAQPPVPDAARPPVPDASAPPPDATNLPEADGPPSAPPLDATTRPVADARLEDASTPPVPDAASASNDGLRGLTPKGGGGCSTLPGRAPTPLAGLLLALATLVVGRSRRSRSARRDDLPPHV